MKQPTAAQKRWREAVRSLGSVISGGPAVIHHPVGRTGRHNKQDIGNWWVVPLTDEEHKALHNGETFGFISRKDLEKRAVIWIRGRLVGKDFMPPEIFEAIMDYHR